MGPGWKPVLVSGGRRICLSRVHADFVQRIQGRLFRIGHHCRNSTLSLRDLRVRISPGQTASIRRGLLGMLAARKGFWCGPSPSLGTSTPKNFNAMKRLDESIGDALNAAQSCLVTSRKSPVIQELLYCGMLFFWAALKAACGRRPRSVQSIATYLLESHARRVRFYRLLAKDDSHPNPTFKWDRRFRN